MASAAISTSSFAEVRPRRHLVRLAAPHVEHQRDGAGQRVRDRVLQDPQPDVRRLPGQRQLLGVHEHRVRRAVLLAQAQVRPHLQGQLAGAVGGALHRHPGRLERRQPGQEAVGDLLERPRLARAVGVHDRLLELDLRFGRVDRSSHGVADRVVEPAHPGIGGQVHPPLFRHDVDASTLTAHDVLGERQCGDADVVVRQRFLPSYRELHLTLSERSDKNGATPNGATVTLRRTVTRVGDTQSCDLDRNR